jgi:hypothetical protein
VGTPEKDKTKV